MPKLSPEEWEKLQARLKQKKEKEIKKLKSGDFNPREREVLEKPDSYVVKHHLGGNNYEHTEFNNAKDALDFALAHPKRLLYAKRKFFDGERLALIDKNLKK